MTDKTAEQLSALTDGELDSQELDLLVRRLERDEELAARWTRYHLIGEAMRNNLPEQLPFDLTARVSAAIAEEAPVVAPAVATRGWKRPVVGLALAASIAAAALIGLPPQQALQPEAGAPVAVQTPEKLPGATAGQVAQVDWERNARLNEFLMSHNESATMNQMSGVIPYARMVGYEEER